MERFIEVEKMEPVINLFGSFDENVKKMCIRDRIKDGSSDGGILHVEELMTYGWNPNMADIELSLIHI